MTALQISIATELACIARLPREDALNHITRLLLMGPDHPIAVALHAEFNRIYDLKEAA